MVGGVKATFLALLALVLIAGGAVSHNEHHGHHQPPPLLEMLPPIGPAGSVAIVAMAQYYLVKNIEVQLRDTIPIQPRPDFPAKVTEFINLKVTGMT